jgi:hypothetical protein
VATSRDEIGIRSDKRRYPAENRDRHGDKIVANGKNEIFLYKLPSFDGDSDCPWNRRQILAQEHKVGGIPVDVGRRSMRGDKCRRISA